MRMRLKPPKVKLFKSFLSENETGETDY